MADDWEIAHGLNPQDPTDGIPAFSLQVGQPDETGVNLFLNGTLGLNYRVDISTNLVEWVPLTNFVSTNAVMRFRDASATNSAQRFYRAVVP